MQPFSQPLLALKSYPFSGALVTLANDATAQDFSAGAEITWDSKAYDFVGAHNGNSTDFVVPAGLDGYFGVFTVSLCVTELADNSSLTLRILRDGTDLFPGSGGAQQYSGAGAEGGTEAWLQTNTHAVELTAGETYSVFLVCTDNSVTLEAGRCNFGFVAYPSVTGALVNTASDATVNLSGGITTLGYDAEVYDPDNAHDNATNNSRITAPAGWDAKYGIVRATFLATSVAANSTARSLFVKNATENFAGRPFRPVHLGAPTTAYQSIASPPLLLAEADYYTYAIQVNDASISRLKEGAFSVQVFDTIEGVLCARNANATVNFSTPAAIAWDGTDVYDTDGLHDPASDNTKIIITEAMAGKYGVFTFTLMMANATNGQQTSARLTKNGSSDFVGGVGMSCQNTANTSASVSFVSSPVLLEEGDEFEIVLYSSDNSVTMEAAWTSFGMYIQDGLGV